MKNYKTALATVLFVMSVSSPVWADGLTVVIGTPPPAPIVETMAPAPGPAEMYAWHAGYWHWIDEQHVWVPGHWVKRPHPRAEWVQSGWEHGPDGYHFHQGHWEDRHDDHHDHGHDDHHEDHR